MVTLTLIDATPQKAVKKRLTMKRQSAALRRTLTDSDIELDKAGAVCDPAMAANTSTSSARRVELIAERDFRTKILSFANCRFGQ